MKQTLQRGLRATEQTFRLLWDISIGVKINRFSSRYPCRQKMHPRCGNQQKIGA